MTREVMLDLLPALLRRAVRVVPAEEDEDSGAPRHAGLARLAENGLLHRLAPGYYALVPTDRIGQDWQPDLESAAWGIAAADDGPRSVALMGLSAARAHGALADSPGAAVIATTRNRPTLRFTDRDATVSFVRRDPRRLKIERHTSTLGNGWVTTVEQTLLDLAAYPQLGGRPDLADQAVTGLIDKADPHVLYSLASAQRRLGALDRILLQV
ncbi:MULTISPECIES: type IV toxin-antitoxin system AbiEi family antitoxin domain-containing protein [Amycolatopsis]|uniref:Transcriptional regulator, AbiEi antitoxin, Type IV TA system n=2 Tax=Amycolatopsis TaxID=1813 RepID=A0A1I3VSC5_9PSEU|nr:type IV toxin-antitoxin system AbiEi family antitoxin [Amycolatopsis sacchari]SFJ98298.1 Transcriptional regulator, AbiEi antitoxin, Type IV TA system [Amycolatopsis sacchari]